jgi:diacylglycerol kinase family enzyme
VAEVTGASETRPDPRPSHPIPALLNCRAGEASAARRILSLDERFDLQEREPAELEPSLRELVRGGARRVVVCGGDGSVAAAAAALAGTSVELAILPGGTLNHFARDHGVPTELTQALELAATGYATSVDLGEVNGRIFLNTLSVGSYVRFVRRRERLERWAGYSLASFLAGLAVMIDLPNYLLEFEAGGHTKRYASPLVFVGIGERDLTVPKLGRRRDGGTPGLHALVVNSRARARLFTLAMAAAARGAERASRMPSLDSILVERCTVELYRARATVALDGEAPDFEALGLRVLRRKGHLSLLA